MSITYDQCDSSVRTLLDGLIDKFHQPLKAAAVTFDLIFASKFDKDGEPLPAVKLHGVPASAKVKITSLEDRARGIADAKIIIDRSIWAKANEQTRAAILDHELTHVTLKDGEGEPDDLGRPKLKLKEHDWMVWGFDVIAERYREFAPETGAMREALEHFKQLSLFSSETFTDALKTRTAAGSAFDKAMRKHKEGVKLTDSDGNVIYEKPTEE